MTTVCSHQPSFFPWIGYWNKIAEADFVIHTAGVPLDYGGYQNRVRLFDTWLTVPVRNRHALIKDVEIDRLGWMKALRTIEQQLGGKKWPHRHRIQWIVEEMSYLGSDSLLELNLRGFHAIRSVLRLGTGAAIDYAEPDPHASKTQRLVARLQRHTPRVATYLAGCGALAYLQPEHWNPAVRLLVQKPRHGLDPSTLLTLIASHDDPLQEVKRACSWELQQDACRSDFSALG